MFKIGQEVELNGEVYKISGTHKRSFILEKDGKHYKATASKLQKIQAQKEKSATFYMERRLEWKRIFNKDAKMPETETEFKDWADSIACDLSPENLYCDGEISHAQASKKRRMLMAEHQELEALAGRKFELVY